MLSAMDAPQVCPRPRSIVENCPPHASYYVAAQFLPVLAKDPSIQITNFVSYVSLPNERPFSANASTRIVTNTLMVHASCEPRLALFALCCKLITALQHSSTRKHPQPNNGFICTFLSLKRSFELSWYSWYVQPSLYRKITLMLCCYTCLCSLKLDSRWMVWILSNIRIRKYVEKVRHIGV